MSHIHVTQVNSLRVFHYFWLSVAVRSTCNLMLIPSMFANKCSPSAGGAEAMAATNAALLAFYFCWEGGPHTHTHTHTSTCSDPSSLRFDLASECGLDVVCNI